MRCGEHRAHTTRPHFRQWCRRCNRWNSLLQTGQLVTSLSGCHDGSTISLSRLACSLACSHIALTARLLLSILSLCRIALSLLASSLRSLALRSLSLRSLSRLSVPLRSPSHSLRLLPILSAGGAPLLYLAAAPGAIKLLSLSGIRGIMAGRCHDGPLTTSTSAALPALV